MDGTFPPPLDPRQLAELRRRRRDRNVALLLVLLGVAALFYALTIVKFH